MPALATTHSTSSNQIAEEHWIDLRGSYPGEDLYRGRTRCILQIGRTNLPVDIPAEVLEKHRMVRADEIVLRIPGEEMLPVQAAPILSEAQQKNADRWIAEMQDFDRF